VADARAGATNDDVARSVREAAARWGPAGSFISLFIGHGVGMGANEPPCIGEDQPGAETVRLEEGMTFAVEPLIWVPDVRDRPPFDGFTQRVDQAIQRDLRLAVAH
jgi:Xaa-Pro dipeptidase